jgi:hypothetical protein
MSSQTQSKIRTLIDIRVCYEKSEILADEDLLSDALCEAEHLGVLAFEEERYLAKVPLLFKSKPRLKASWERGFYFTQELFEVQHCSTCRSGTPCHTHGY